MPGVFLFILVIYMYLIRSANQYWNVFLYNLPQNLDRYRWILPKRDRLWRNKGKKNTPKLRWIASLKFFIFVYNLYCYKDRSRWIRFAPKNAEHTINTIPDNVPWILHYMYLNIRRVLRTKANHMYTCNKNRRNF